MLYAINSNNKIPASPGASGSCPSCNGEMVPKCGDIKIWHWAHKQNEYYCDNGGESDWHYYWKSFFDPQYVEVRVDKNGFFKIADVKEKSGLVIEFQNSSINSNEIDLRESHYENMIWVFNCLEPYKEKRLRCDFRNKRFFWYQSRQSIVYCCMPLFLHLEPDLLIECRDFDSKNGCLYGDFIEYSYEDFLWNFSSLNYYQIKQRLLS